MMDAHTLLQCVSSHLTIYSSNRFYVSLNERARKTQDTSEPPLKFSMHSCASDALNQKLLLEEKPNCAQSVKRHNKCFHKKCSKDEKVILTFL
jgi:hypothetical protein